MSEELPLTTQTNTIKGIAGYRAKVPCIVWCGKEPAATDTDDGSGYYITCIVLFGFNPAVPNEGCCYISGDSIPHPYRSRTNSAEAKEVEVWPDGNE